MAARARTLTLKTQVEVKDADKLTNLGKKLQRTGAALSAFVTTPLLLLGGVAARAASDLNESFNAVNVTFGKTADAINAIGETSAESFGLSQRAFNEVATQFSAFAETVAGEGGDVAKIIGDLTARGSDFASVYNLEVSDALALFQSGLAGQTEPLRRFGIDLSAAAVEAHALATGISDGIGPLTEAEKVQARYALLMERTAKVQGDFANTSGEVANQQRIAAAAAEDAAAALGQRFLPIQQKVIGVLTSAIEAWSKLPAPMQDAIVIFGVAAATLGPLLLGLGSLLRIIVKLGGPKAVSGINGLGTALKSLLGPIGLLLAAAQGISIGVGAINEALGGATGAFERLGQAAGGFPQARDAIKELEAQTGQSSEAIILELDRLIEAGADWETALASALAANTGALKSSSSAAQAWSDEQKAAFAAMNGHVTTAMDGATTAVGLGVDGMAAELGELPQKGADALLAEQFKLTDAVDELIRFMDEALSPAEESFNARMFLASQAAADGLASGNPLVVQKTQEMVNAANAVLAQHGKSAFNYGFNFGAEYARGIVNSLGLIKDAGRQMGGALRNIVAIESEPKDHSSPLFGHTKWGGNFVKDWADSILGQLGTLRSAGGMMAAALVPSVGGSSVAPQASSGAGGDIHIHLTVEGDLTSDRERGVVDLIGRSLGVLGFNDRVLAGG